MADRLEVTVDNQSSFTLTIHQNRVEYNWQGVANHQFGDDYRFFDYVASRFRIPQKS